MVVFLDGAVALGCTVVGLFFLRFWRESADRLFAAFGVAFLIFAIDYTVRGLVPLADDTRPYVYLFRLAGFAAIIGGIIDKNRKVGRKR